MRYYLGPCQQSEFDDTAELYWHAPAGTVGLIDLRSIPGVTQATYGFFCLPDHLSLDSSYDLLGQGHLSEIPTDGKLLSRWETLLGLPETPESATLLDLLWDTLGVYADPTGDDRAKPIIPRRNGVLELHLGGHSLVKSGRFSQIPTRQRNAILDVEKRDLARIRQDSRDGRLINARTRRVDDTMHRQVLQSLVEKYGVPWEMLVPQSWPRNESPLRHDTVVSDDFNRSDENLDGSTASVGGVSQGWDWGVLSGSFSVDSNQCRYGGGGNGFAVAQADLSTSDMESSVLVVEQTSNNDRPGVLTRKDNTSTATYYRGNTRGTHSQVQMFKCVNGSFTQLGSNVSVSGNHTITQRSDGSTQSLYYDSDLKIDVTDTSITGNTRAGVVGNAGNNALIDDFLAGDLAAGGGQVHPILQHGQFNGGAL